MARTAWSVLALRVSSVVATAALLLTGSAPAVSAGVIGPKPPHLTSAGDAAGTAPVPCPGCWQPAPTTTWQYQLQGRIDTTVDADAFDIDLFDTPVSVVKTLHTQGKRAVCYVSAGSWERWRPDADDFPAVLLGKKLDGWPGERWLDIRRIDLLAPIMAARLDICADKGFDAVEFDNVEGYANPSGFPLTGGDQLAYNEWLAGAAHERGLAVGLKNDLRQVKELEPHFDFAVNEECFDYAECSRLRPFVTAGKAVLIVEYDRRLAAFCDEADELGAVAMRKKLSLRGWRRPCP